jgi:hypothetical protein
MRLIWTDQAGPVQARARLRRIMSQQLTKNRLASGFQPPAKVSAKSGGLVGVIRNEVGVVDYPDGRSYAMAVFTQIQLAGRDAAINAAIGTAAASAVRALIEQEQDEIAAPLTESDTSSAAATRRSRPTPPRYVNSGTYASSPVPSPPGDGTRTSF